LLESQLRQPIDLFVEKFPNRIDGNTGVSQRSIHWGSQLIVIPNLSKQLSPLLRCQVLRLGPRRPFLKHTDLKVLWSDGKFGAQSYVISKIALDLAGIAEDATNTVSDIPINFACAIPPSGFMDGKNGPS
jgi:hypothetical protein